MRAGHVAGDEVEVIHAYPSIGEDEINVHIFNLTVKIRFDRSDGCWKVIIPGEEVYLLHSEHFTDQLARMVREGLKNLPAARSPHSPAPPPD